MKDSERRARELFENGITYLEAHGILQREGYGVGLNHVKFYRSAFNAGETTYSYQRKRRPAEDILDLPSEFKDDLANYQLCGANPFFLLLAYKEGYASARTKLQQITKNMSIPRRVKFWSVLSDVLKKAGYLEYHETSMRPRPKGRGLIGLVSSFPTGNSVLKNGVSTVVNDNVTDAGVAALEQYSENLPDSK